MWCNILLRTMDARGTLTLILISILFNSIHKIANSGAFFHTEATSDLDPSQGHMQGQLSTNCDPRERLIPSGPGGTWLMGPGCGVSVCDNRVDFSLIGVVVPSCDRDQSTSRRSTVHSDDTCTKNTKSTALFPRKSSVQDERCAHCSLQHGFAYGPCS